MILSKAIRRAFRKPEGIDFLEDKVMYNGFEPVDAGEAVSIIGGTEMEDAARAIGRLIGRLVGTIQKLLEKQEMPQVFLS